MSVVTIPTPLRPHAEGQSRVEVQGNTVGAILSDLGTRYPELHKRLFDGNGELQRYVNVYLNNEDIRFLDDLETAVTDKDVVDIIPAVAGG